MAKKKDQSQFQEWYSKNKEDHNAKRRERYRKDKKFQKRTREQNRESSERYRKKLREDGIIIVDGERVPGEYVADIMRSLGLEPSAIIKYRMRDVVPKFPYSQPAAVKPNQAQLLRDFFEAIGTDMEETAARTMRRAWDAG